MTDSLPPCAGITDGTLIELPLLDQAFGCDLHPDYYALLERQKEWVTKRLLPGEAAAADRLLRDNLSTLFVCMSYFDHDAERVYDVCNLTDWLFIHDHDVANLRTAQGRSDAERKSSVYEYLDRLNGMLRGHEAPGFGWAVESIFELIQRFHAKASAEMFAKLVAAFEYYATQTIRDEADDLLDQRVSNLDEYIAMRATRGSSATTFYRVVTEYVADAFLADEVFDDPNVADFWKHVMDHWYLPNDILSFRAECYRGDHNNAVCLLRRADGLSLQDAVDRVAELIDESQRGAAQAFARIVESPIGADDGVMKCLRTFLHIGAANQRWSYMAPRYHGPDHVWNGVLSGPVRLTRTHTIFPPVPSQSPYLAATQGAGSRAGVGGAL